MEKEPKPKLGSDLGKQGSLGGQRVLPSAVGVALEAGVQDGVAAGQHQPAVEELEAGAAALPAVAAHVAQHVREVAVELLAEARGGPVVEHLLQRQEVQVGGEEGGDVVVEAVVPVAPLAPAGPLEDGGARHVGEGVVGVRPPGVARRVVAGVGLAHAAGVPRPVLAAGVPRLGVALLVLGVGLRGADADLDPRVVERAVGGRLRVAVHGTVVVPRAALGPPRGVHRAAGGPSGAVHGAIGAAAAAAVAPGGVERAGGRAVRTLRVERAV